MNQYDVVLSQNVALTGIEYNEKFVSGVRGGIITFGENGVPVTLPSGDATDILQSDGTNTDLKWTSLNNTGLFLLNQTIPQTFTAGTVTGSGLLKVTAGTLGLDTTSYVSGSPWTGEGYYVGDGSAFATSAQGSLADSALQSLSGAVLTADLTVTSGASISGVNTGDNATNTQYSGLVSFPGFGTSNSTVAYGDHTHSGIYEPVFSKNTGFNKNLGTTTGTVLEGRTFGTAANSDSTDFALSSIYPSTGLTTGCIPYKGVTSLLDSGIFVDGSTGNVGIGTTPSTTSALSVNGIADFAGSVYKFAIDANNVDGPRLALQSIAGSEYFTIGAWSNANNFSSKTRDLRLYNDNAGMIYMKYSTGNVGIGTSLPSADDRLTVNGNIRSHSSSYTFTLNPTHTSGPRIQLGNTSDQAAYFEIGAWSSRNNFNSKTRDLNIYNSGGNIFLKNSSGYVGINNSAPVYRLDVNGAVNSTTGFYENGVKISGGYWYGDGAGIRYDDNIGIGVASSSSFSISAGGAANFVGYINTASDLRVGGTIMIDSNKGIRPASMAEGTANTNSIYWSTTRNALCYKQPDGYERRIYLY